MAAALDEALEKIRKGAPLDRDALIGRYPALAEMLDTLDQLRTPPAKPQQIGRYRIERELGAGGFGVVYLAHDPDVCRHVAIKILHPGRLHEPQSVSRFQREAQAIGRLRHPGIVALFDFSPGGPPYYFVTEYVEGVDPRVWCQQTQANYRQIAELMARIAEAAEYAHQHGICHRDLKPANVLVDAQGQPHVLDFGLARLEDWNDRAPRDTPTGDGAILGSMTYMSPEQICGRSHQADARSDVYSLGVMLYELLTGVVPFGGPLHTLAVRVLDEAPARPRSLVRGIPEELEAICLRALNKKPCDRYHRAADLAADLRAFAVGQPIQAESDTLITRVRRFLDRRNMDLLRQGWPRLLVLLGLVIFAGSALCNYWEWTLTPVSAWWAILATKAVQVAVMLGVAVWLRPPPEGNSSGLTAAERQIWSLIPGYYGAFLTLFILNRLLLEPIPPAPILALFSGMGYASLGATIWGWFYVWSAFFFLLAVAIALCPGYGLTLLGAGWLVCLCLGGLHMRLST